MIREQDGVIDRRAQLDRGNNQVSDVEDGLVGEVRDRRVDPDAGLDGKHQDDRQGDRLEGEQQYDEHRRDRDEVDLRHVCRDRHHDIGGAHALTRQKPFARIILLGDIADARYQVKRLVAFVIHLDGKHHAAVMVGDELGKRILIDIFRRNDRTRVIHIGEDARHFRLFLKRGGKLLLPRGVAARHHHHIGVALAKDRFDILYVRAQRRIRSKDMGLAVVVAVLLRAEIGRNDHNDENQQHRNHHVRHAFAQLVEGRHEGTMARLFQQAIGQQDERRGEQEYRHQADGNALAQHKTHVRTNLELHQAQRQEADDRRQTAGRDGHRRFAQRLNHRLVRIRRILLAFLKAMQQEDGVIQRDSQLKDAARGVGNKGDRAEYQVRAAVDEDGDAQACQHNQRLQPRGRRDRQHEENEDDRRDGDDAHLRHRAGRRVRGRYRGTADGVFVADQRAQVGGRLNDLGFLDRDGEQRRAVLVIRLDRIGVQRLQRLIDVRHVVQPVDRDNAVHRFKLLLVSQCRRDIDVAYHDAHIRYAALVFLFHHVQRDGGLRLRRQIVVDIIIHADELLHQRTNHGNDDERRDHQLGIARRRAIKTVHDLIPPFDFREAAD